MAEDRTLNLLTMVEGLVRRRNELLDNAQSGAR
jgi:hypothetical protein